MPRTEAEREAARLEREAAGMPSGAELVRVRRRLVSICDKHAPSAAPAARKLLAAAVAELPKQLELFSAPRAHRR